MHRLANGEPLRAAIAAAGTSLPRLAEKTREIDPDGVGISTAMIGFYVSTGRSARDSATERTANLIADALGVNVGSIFAAA